MKYSEVYRIGYQPAIAGLARWLSPAYFLGQSVQIEAYISQDVHVEHLPKWSREASQRR